MTDSRLIFEAIATRRCLEAVYNRVAVTLAPHILYTRHDAMYLDAITVARDGRPPRETRIGSFRLTGLGDARLAAVPFRPDPAFRADDERYAGVTLFAVE